MKKGKYTPQESLHILFGFAHSNVMSGKRFLTNDEYINLRGKFSIINGHYYKALKGIEEGIK